MINHILTMGSTIKIGVLANAVECHVETIRYYEEVGLLPPSAKSANGYGEYSDDHLNLVRLIRHSKDFGFTQKQIRELVRLTTSQDSPCEEMYQLTLVQLDFVKSKLQMLRNIRKELTTPSNACKQNKLRDCPVLDQLAMVFKRQHGQGDDNNLILRAILPDLFQ